MANKKISELTAATALTGTEQFPVVQGGTTKRTTVSALSGAYAPLAGAVVWLPAQQFTVQIGAPNLAVTGGGSRFMGYQFDAAADEQVNTTFRVPAGWLTYGIDLYWSNSGAGTGDVRWSALQSQRAAGDDLAVGDFGVQGQTLPAPLLNILTVTAPTAVVTVDPTKTINHLRVTRAGTNVGDTLANDAVMFGCMLRRIT